jgi:hypothetical protein
MPHTFVSKTKTFCFRQTLVCHKQELFVYGTNVFAKTQNTSFWSLSDCHYAFWGDVFSLILNTKYTFLVNACFRPLTYPDIFGWPTRVFQKPTCYVFGKHVFVINKNFLFLVHTCVSKTISSCLRQTRV